jgi:hypothetical protein
MTCEDMQRRFDYHAPDEEAARLHDTVRMRLKRVAMSMDILLPEGREKALAITKLEEAMFWANAAIAREDKGQ